MIGTFDLLTSCVKTIFNPFLNSDKNGIKNVTCEQSLRGFTLENPKNPLLVQITNHLYLVPKTLEKSENFVKNKMEKP